MRHKGFLPILLTGFLLISIKSYSIGQANAIDSLKVVLASTESDSIRGETYFDLCELLAWREPDLALSYMDTVRQMTLYNELNHWKAWVSYFEGDANLTQGFLDKGEAKVRLAISAFEELSEELGLAASYHLLGKRAYRDQNWPNAITNFSIAKNRFEKLNKSKGVAGSLNGLGIVYEYSKMWDKAIDTYGEAIELYKAIDNIPGMVTNYANRANVYHGQLQYEKSRADYEKAMELIEQTNHSDQLLAHINSNYANLLVDLKEFSKAKKAARLGSQYYISVGNYPEAASATINLAKANRETNKLNLARKNIEKALSLLESSTDYIALTDVTREAATIFEILKIPQKANFFLNQHIVFKDSLLNQNTANQVAEISAKYETEKKEQEIEFLNEKNEFAAIQIASSKKQNIRLSLGLGLLGLLSVFLLYT